MTTSKMTSQTSPTQRRTLATFTLTCLLVTSGWQTAWADAAPRVKFATSEGDFVVEVYPEKAPKTVENFGIGEYFEKVEMINEILNYPKITRDLKLPLK